MKRFGLLLLVMIALIGCTAGKEKDIDGVVLLAKNDYLIKNDEIGLLRLLKEDWQLTAGDEVRISFDGTVLESYPSQLGKVSDVRVTGKVPDAIGWLVDGYLKLVRQDDLGGDTTFLYVDLNPLSLFDQHDKFALLEALRLAQPRQVEEATLETLKESGKFDEAQLFIKDGTLLSMESTDVTKDSFTLRISIYRSGRGAIGATYAVRIKSDTWELKLLEQWIAHSCSHTV